MEVRTPSTRGSGSHAQGNRPLTLGILLLSVLLLAGFMRVYKLGDESLGLDEAISAFFAQEDLSAIVNESGPQRNNPPLYWVLLHFWVHVFGIGEAALRSLSAAFGILAVAAIYAVGKELVDHSLGITAALLSAVSAFHVYYSQEARNYSLLLLLSALSFLYFIRILKRGKGADYAAYILVSLLMGYTHIYSVFILAAQALYWLLYARGYRARAKGLLSSWGALAMGFIPLLLLLGPKTATIAQKGFWLPRPSGKELVENLAYFSGTGSHVSWPLILYLLLVCLAFGSVFFRSRPLGFDISHPHILLLLWLAVPILIPFLLSLFMTPILHPRYTIGASAAFLLLAAQGIHALKPRWIAAGLLICVTVFAGYNLHEYYSQDVKPQWREAADIIQTDSRPDDVILLHRYFITSPFLYYIQPEIPYHRTDGFRDETQFKEFVQAITDGKQRLWLILSGGGEDPEVLSFLLKTIGEDAVRMQRDLVMIRLYLFDLSAPGSPAAKSSEHT